jgi:predicted amidohydrolase
VTAPLSIAVAQPRIRAKDIRANALEHAALIRRAQARLVVFPELSLTGYELDAAPISTDDNAFGIIADACAETDAVSLVGAPVAQEDGTLNIATVLVSSNGAEVAYCKTFLGGNEPARFSGVDGPQAIEIDGWRVGMGICKDTGIEQHITETAALDIGIYAAGLVHLPEELTMQEERAARIAQTCSAFVAFASFAGPTGDGYDRTAGVSSIWAADGTPIVRAGIEPGEIARAILTATGTAELRR